MENKKNLILPIVLTAVMIFLFVVFLAFYLTFMKAEGAGKFFAIFYFPVAICIAAILFISIIINIFGFKSLGKIKYLFLSINAVLFVSTVILFITSV